VGPLRNVFSVFDMDQFRVGNLILGKRIDEDVETSYPQISIIFFLCSELVDSFFGDEVEFVVLDNLDRVDLR